MPHRTQALVGSHSWRAVALCAGVLVALPNTVAGQTRLPWEAVATKLVERMAISPGERVLLVAMPGDFSPLVPVLRRLVARAGGHDLGAIAVDGSHPAGWETPFGRDLEGLTVQEMGEYFLEVDVAVMLPGAGTQHAPYAAMRALLRTGRARTIHFHWAGAYDLQGNLMPTDRTVSQTLLRALLQTNYSALALHQRRFESEMRGQVIRVTTPLGTDITFQIGDRPVTKQDGDASARAAATALNLIDREIELPAGAIRVAPIEGSVDGRMAFPPTVWQGQMVEGLVLEIARGRVVNITATTGLEAVEAELDAAGSSGRAFREFALGFNPRLAIPTVGSPWIPYYGYGAGVVRLSLGDNTELGGAVEGGYVRWNFFHDATVTVGEVVWVSEGRLVR
ncbi:MAG: aminopeptidase [Gemmatimonadetes bacterium]|nr:aminopeptidase [Gemmatimonadota bacterium]